MRYFSLFLILLSLASPAYSLTAADPMISTGRQPDPTAKTLAEIREAEQRRIPLDIALKASNHYQAGHPVEVTVIVTNLFDAPLLLNSRMLVNHPLLEGELAFRIMDSRRHKLEIKRLITPLSIRDSDYVKLGRGESIQRSVDLADLYGLLQKGDYTVQVAYRNDCDRQIDGLQAWKGLLWSDPSPITLH